MTTDEQAALAAAVEITSVWGSNDLGRCEANTLQMADAFLAWLRRPGRTTIERGTDAPLWRPMAPFGERIRSAHHHQSPVNADLCVCGLGWPCNGHVLDPSILTPSGCRACVCGEKWPCSQRPVDQPAQSMAPTEALDLTGLRQHLRDAEPEERGGR